MSPIGHDPVERLNAHHADDVLAIARTFGGQPGATAATVVAIDGDGLRLAVTSPTDEVGAVVTFRDALPDIDPSLSMRLTFRELARRAAHPH
jgi:hypothetical protein